MEISSTRKWDPAAGRLPWIIGFTAAVGAGAIAYTLTLDRPHLSSEVKAIISEPVAVAEPAPAVPSAPPAPTAAQLAREQLVARGARLSPISFATAAATGDQSLIDLYLRAGFDINGTDSFGRTALHHAAEADRTAIALHLVKQGAAVDRAASDGQTPLLAAAMTGSWATFEALLESGASPFVADERLLTAAHYAAVLGATDGLRLLAEHKVDPSAACCESGTPLIHALKHRRPETTEYLIGLNESPEWSEGTREALFTAVRAKDSAMAGVLLRSHPAPPLLMDGSQPLLAYIVAWGELDQLRFLLEAGATADVPITTPVEPQFRELISNKVLAHYLGGDEGLTPLMVAAGMANLDAVNLLLEHGARRGAATKRYKLAALTFAAKSGDAGVQRVLLGKPPMPGGDELHVEISLASQKAKIMQSGIVVMSTPISSGRAKFRTPTGDFVITDKHRVRRSSIYDVDMPYFMRLSCSEVGLHQGNLPGYPASHGCIRMPKKAVADLFKKLPVGTFVRITH